MQKQTFRGQGKEKAGRDYASRSVIPPAAHGSMLTVSYGL